MLKTISTLLILLLSSSIYSLEPLNGRVISFNLTFAGHASFNQTGTGFLPKLKINNFLQASVPLTTVENGSYSVVFDPNYRTMIIPWIHPPGRTVGVNCAVSPNAPTPQQGQCVYNPNAPINSSVLGGKYWEYAGDIPFGYQATTSWSWTSDIGSNPPFNASVGLIGAGPAQWGLADAGVLGLGVNTGSVSSSLWDYMFNTYQTTGETLYATWYLTSPSGQNLSWWQVFNGSDASLQTGLFNGSQFRISDNLSNILDAPSSVNNGIWANNGMVGNNSQTWTIPNVSLFSSDTAMPLIANTSVCLAMNARSTFLVNSTYMQKFKNVSNDAVCRGFKCGPGSFLLNGAEMILNFKDANSGNLTNLTVGPQAYLYNNQSNYIQVSVDDIARYQYVGCDPSISNQLGLGRMFFYNWQVVLKMNKTSGVASIGFFPYSTRPTLAHYANVATLVIIGLLFVVFLFVCIMSMRWKGISEASDEDDEMDHTNYNRANEERERAKDED